MKLLTAVVVTWLTIVLTVIAFDLHQLALTAGVVTGVGPYAVHLTRQQEAESIKKSVDDNAALLDQILKAPSPGRRKPVPPSTR